MVVVAIFGASLASVACHKSGTAVRSTPQPGSANQPRAFFPIAAAWTLPLNSGLTTAPGYDSSRGYFPLDGNQLVAYDLTRGTRLWLVSTTTDTEPAAGDELVFVLEHDVLTARRAADGSKVWAVPFAEKLTVPPVWDTGWLVAANASGTVFAFRAADGQLIWSRNVGSPLGSRPAPSGHRVFVATEDGRIVALDIQSGEIAWDRRLGGAGSDILALDERLFVGSRDNYMYCLRTDDGSRDWRVRTGADIIGAPVVDEHNLYFVSLDNVLRALNRGHGVQQWIQGLSFRPTAGPVKADDTLIVNGIVPGLKGFSTKDGRPSGDQTTSGELAAPLHFLSNPLTGTNELIVITRDVLKGATVTALRRSGDPAIAPFAALPNAMRAPAAPPGSNP